MHTPAKHFLVCMIKDSLSKMASKLSKELLNVLKIKRVADHKTIMMHEPHIFLCKYNLIKSLDPLCIIQLYRFLVTFHMGISFFSSLSLFFMCVGIWNCSVNRANTDYVLCQYVILHNLRSAIQHYYFEPQGALVSGTTFKFQYLILYVASSLKNQSKI